MNLLTCLNECNTGVGTGSECEDVSKKLDRKRIERRRHDRKDCNKSSLSWRNLPATEAVLALHRKGSR